jgi:CheY-like chemotaxis protein
MNSIATRRILLADDNAPYRAIIHRELAKVGYLVSEADNGRSAVALVTESPCGTYDVVVMDYSLDEDMTGGEAVNAMRTKCPDQLVIFLSGHDLPGDLRRGEVFLQKPALPEHLIQAIECLVRSKADTEPPEAP